MRKEEERVAVAESYIRSALVLEKQLGGMIGTCRVCLD